MINSRLWRVNIFGQALLDLSSPKSDDPLMEIEDREDDPSPEGIVPALFLLGKDEAQLPREF